jgi:hypothetical protein
MDVAGLCVSHKLTEFSTQVLYRLSVARFISGTRRYLQFS